MENTSEDSSDMKPEDSNNVKTEESDNIETEDKPIKTIKKPRERIALWRWNEDGSYNSKPIDPNYFNNYMKTRVVCNYCQRLSTVAHITLHRKSQFCMKAQREKTITDGKLYTIVRNYIDDS